MNRSTILLLTTGLLLAIAYGAIGFFLPYFVDDAFISFRITENLIATGKPWYNPGVPVYTSTSILYPYLNSVWAVLFGNTWVHFIPVINGVFLSLSVTICLKKAVSFSEKETFLPNLGAILLLLPWFLEFKTLAYGNSGLETSLYLFLIAVFCLPENVDSEARGKSTWGWFLILLRPEGILVPLARGMNRLGPWDLKKWGTFCAAGLLSIVFWAVLGELLYGNWIPQSILAKANHHVDRLLEIRKGFAYFLFADHPLEMAICLGGFIFFPGIRKQFYLPLTWLAFYCLFFSVGAAWWPWYLPPVFVPFWYLSLLSTKEILLFLQRSGPKKSLRGFIPVIVVALSGIRAIPLLKQNLEKYSVSSEAYKVRLESSREIGKYIQSHIPKESSILLEPIGMVGWFAKDRTFIDYPGLATPEMSRLLRDSGKKVPHRLTDPGTNAGIIHHFKPDWILLWPEEVKACQGIPEFKNEYTCETRLAYFPAEKRMDSVSVFRRIRN